MTTDTSTTMRRCIGSTRFDIEAHDAELGDYPVQPSQKDGLGRMCKPHWRAYTNAPHKAAVARKAETTDAPAPEPEPEVLEVDDADPVSEMPAPRKARHTKAKAEPTETDDDER